MDVRLVTLPDGYETASHVWLDGRQYEIVREPTGITSRWEVQWGPTLRIPKTRVGKAMHRLRLRISDAWAVINGSKVAVDPDEEF